MRYNKIFFSLVFVFFVTVFLPDLLGAQSIETRSFLPSATTEAQIVVSPEVVCTQEAKLCPDGSYVSRTGPNCEFAPCSGENSSCGQIKCLRYDPVCGTDGKTYACGEADALACGVKVAYKGECKEKEDSYQEKLSDYEKCGPLPGAQGNWVCKDGKWVLSSFGFSEATKRMTVAKCGFNTYEVFEQCGDNSFKAFYFQCYDGYEEKNGGADSCKSLESWKEYATKVCANRCGSLVTPKPDSSLMPPPSLVKPEQQTTSQPTVSGTAESGASVRASAVCFIPDELSQNYSKLILDLKKAEEAGDKELASAITQKITALKEEIEKVKKQCLSATQAPSAQALVKPLPVAPLPLPSIITVDRCQEVNQWENKITHYEELSKLNDEDLKYKSGFTREEIKKILEELYQGIEKVKKQCEEQEKSTETLKTGVPRGNIIVRNIRKPFKVVSPVKPVIVESGEEISNYYKAKIEEIVEEGSAEEQIEKLKTLRTEIDDLIAKLIKSKEKIEAEELKGLVSEIKITPQEIKADNVSVSLRGIEKKDIRRGIVIAKVAGKLLNIFPGDKKVVIEDENLKVETETVSVKDEKLFIGNSEVKIFPSQVASNLNILPKEAELKEENGKAVYKFKVLERRRLFGFIPLNITKIITSDAEFGNSLGERLPWWSFLTLGSK